MLIRTVALAAFVAAASISCSSDDREPAAATSPAATTATRTPETSEPRGSVDTDPAPTQQLPEGEPAELGFRSVVVDQRNPAFPHAKTLADLDGDGALDIVVASSEGEGLWWYAGPDWAKRPIRARGSWTTDMQATDVDGDGDDDIVVPDDRALRWYENPGADALSTDPEWVEHTIGRQGARAHDVEVADMDGDGRVDVVTRPSVSGRADAEHGVQLWRQVSPDQWALVRVSARAGEGTAIGDVDADGDLDLAVNGAWLRNEGGGTRWTELELGPTLPERVSVVLADMDGDGTVDIVTGPSESEHEPLLLLTATDPTSPWSSQVIDPDVSFLHTFKAEDMDGDGDLDLVTAAMAQADDPDEVSVYVNEAGSYRQVVAGMQGSHNLRVGDLDGDGDLDIMGANWNDEQADDSGAIRIWLNEPGASGAEEAPEPVEGAWTRVVVDDERPYRALFVRPGDLDGDGLDDLATGGWWYRNPGGTGAWERRLIGNPLRQVAVVHDFDDDGDLDLLGTQGRSSQPNTAFALAVNDGTGKFTVQRNVVSAPAGNFLQGATVADLDDGGSSVVLSWHEGGGTGALTAPDEPTGQWSWRELSPESLHEDLSAADIDGDGDEDVLLGTSWLRNDGGSFSGYVIAPGAGVPDRNRLADLDGDGRLDAVVGDEAVSELGAVTWYQQPEDPTAPWIRHEIAELTGPMSLDVADVDGDDDLDVIVGEHDLADPSSARLVLLVNDGEAETWTQVVLATGDEHHDGAQLFDADGDGDLDAASIGWGSDDVLIYLQP